MVCPYCGQEMELGYIQCRDSVIWSTKKRAIAALPPLRSSYIVLGSGGGPFSGASVRAYHCDKCKKIEIDCNHTND